MNSRIGQYELLDHTADVAVRATGRDFADALSWLAQGMVAFVAELETVEPRERIEVTVTAHDRDSLVVNWLNELLYRYEADGFLPCEFEVTVDASETSLAAMCKGEPVDANRHRVSTQVKAATYHDLSITHNGAWGITVVLDV